MQVDSGILLLLMICLALVAGLIHGAVGLGFSMILTGSLAMLVSIEHAIALTLIPTIVLNVVSIGSGKNPIKAVKKYAALALISTLGSILGTKILIDTEAKWIFELLLSTSIILYLFSSQLKFDSSIIAKNPTASMIFFGFFAGIMGGFTNAMSPLLLIYFLESESTNKNTMVQGLNLCFLLGKVSQLGVFFYTHAIDREDMMHSLLILIAGAASLILGIKIRNKIPVLLYQTILRKILLLLAIIIGIQALWKGV